jgi:hypothetical protein
MVEVMMNSFKPAHKLTYLTKVYKTIVGLRKVSVNLGLSN